MPRSTSAKRRRRLVVDDPHHLLGGDAVGGQRGDERAGARADVDVELVDRAVDRQQVERPQRADLVDAAREAAAAQHERGLRRAPPAPRRRGASSSVRAARLPLRPVLSSSTTLSIGRHRDCGPTRSVAYPPARRCTPALASAPCCSRSPRASPPLRRRAAGPEATRRRARARDALGRAPSGAYCVDLDSGRRAVRARGRTASACPASVEKLYTTSTALLRFGPTARSPPARSAPPPSTPGGVLAGDLYLRGGGDPTFGAAPGRRAGGHARPPDGAAGGDGPRDRATSRRSTPCAARRRRASRPRATSGRSAR